MTKMIKVYPKDLRHLTIQHGGLILKRFKARGDFGEPVEDPVLPLKERTRLAARYTESLQYWFDIFLRGKKKNTPEYAGLILAYLLKHGQIPFTFEFVPLRRMRSDLVQPRLTGRPRNQQQQRIKFYPTLLSLLDQMEKDGLIEKRQEIEYYARSDPDKEKENTYYRFRSEIFNLPILSPEKLKLHEGAREVSRLVAIDKKYRHLKEQSYKTGLEAEGIKRVALYLLREQGYPHPETALRELFFQINPHLGKNPVSSSVKEPMKERMKKARKKEGLTAEELRRKK